MKTTKKTPVLASLLLGFGLALGGAACDNDRDEVDDDDVVEVERTRDTTVTGDEKTGVAVKVNRDEWRREYRTRLDKIDARLSELRARTDEKSKAAAEELRVKRDELSARLDRAGDEADSGWENFKADVSRGFDQLEDDLDARF